MILDPLLQLFSLERLSPQIGKLSVQLIVLLSELQKHSVFNLLQTLFQHENPLLVLGRLGS